MKLKATFKRAIVLPVIAVLVFLFLTNRSYLAGEFENIKPVDLFSRIQSKFSPEPTLRGSVLSSDSSGQRFQAKKLKKFNPEHRIFKNWHHLSSPWKHKSSASSCPNWAVVATIFNPSEAVKRVARLPNWSMVIVADIPTPVPYDFNSHIEDSESNCKKEVKFLSVEDQKQEPWNSIGMPWKTFARKNVGYIYAISHGARIVFDFDDDNELIFWGPGSQSLSIQNAPILANAILSWESQTSTPVFIPAQTRNLSVFNPYPMLGCPFKNCWPRGFPLNLIRQPSFNMSSYMNSTVAVDSLAVVQSLAQHQPDVDAIFRMTKETPFRFEQRFPEFKPLLVPESMFSPYNAQATLHFYKGLWAMYLPSTVSARVSDIWRSYVSQRIFSELRLRVGFLTRPLVIQNRNQHGFLQDFMAEKALYKQAGELVNWLMTEFKHSCLTLPCLIEEIWIALYELGIVEIEECKRVQSWIDGLVKIGYQFPRLTTDTNTSVNQTRVSNNTEDKVSHVTSEEKEINHVTSKYQHVNCKSVQDNLVLWVPDFHDGTRIDFPSLVSKMGGTAIVAGTKGGFVRHPSVSKITNLKLIGHGHVSPALAEHVDLGGSSGFKLQRLMKNNFEFYRNDSLFANSSAVICSFLSSLCELFLPLNKTIIYAPAHRYNIGRCTVDQWTLLNERLQKLAIRTPTRPPHFVAAMSKYDAEYMNYYTGLSPLILESSALGYTEDFDYGRFHGIHALSISHANDSSKKRIEFPLMGDIEGLLAALQPIAGDLKFLPITALYSNWGLFDLIRHDGIIYVPSSVTSYKMTELYSMSIPLFVPSLKYFADLKKPMLDRPSTSVFYCNNQTLDAQMVQHKLSRHIYSPNTFEVEAELYWLQFSDFYEWPFITTFDSPQDLVQKIRTANFWKIHQRMRSHNQKRLSVLENMWCNISAQLSPSMKWSAPDTFEAAVADWM